MSLYKALLAVQDEAETLQKTELNPHFKSHYVGLDSLHETVMPLLNRHGLTWCCRPTRYEDGAPGLRYELTHAESGEKLEDCMPLLLAKQDPQGQGSGITYARRYALMAVLGLVADEDDDGNAATGRRKAAPKPKPKAKTEEPKSDGSVTDETLAALGKLYRDLKMAPADLRSLLDAAGAEGRETRDLTEDQARFIVLQLEEKQKGGEDQ